MRISRLLVISGLLLMCAAVLECHAQIQNRFDAARAMMVENEIATAGIKQPAVLAVMRTTPRHEFLPAALRQYAYYDMSLPIGEQQTISPPFVVAWMTQQLELRPNDKVLEIGTGSGYHAAVLSGLVKQVYTIEINETLAERAAQTFERLGYKNISHKVGDGYQGWSEHAPFDKIIVTCSPESVPQPLVDQLRGGGRIVIPLGQRYQQTLTMLEKENGSLVVKSREPTFFVPMTGKAESLRRELSDEPLTPLVNGDFEEQLKAEQPAGWYYVRQAKVVAVDSDAAGPQSGRGHCIAFANRVGGRSSQALQAIGVDGRAVTEMKVELLAQGRDIRQGQTADQRAKVSVSFFDENRMPLGEQVVGPWTGTFAWSRRGGQVKVPREARLAIVAIGLLGATGELSCDEIEVRAADGGVARR